MSTGKPRYGAFRFLPMAGFVLLIPMYMGLIDIWHGEPDALLEWNIVWMSFWALALLHAVTLVGMVLKALLDRGQERVSA